MQVPARRRCAALGPAARLAATTAAAVAFLASCQRAGELTSCAQPLAGLWREDDDDDHVWAIQDREVSLEAYTLFDDTAAPPGSISPAAFRSPRSLSLVRHGRALTGRIERWVMRDDHFCQLRALARVSRCGGDSLWLEVAPLHEPHDLSTCASPAGAATRATVTRWRRVGAR